MPTEQGQIVTVGVTGASGAILAQKTLAMLDTDSRVKDLKDKQNVGYCNITKCCTNVCPEEIHITDNAIIPLKERVVDEYYDPLRKMVMKIFGAT